MGKHLHFDCFNGISGDMTLGALVDLGLDIAELEKGLAGLPVGPFRLRAEKIKRSGIMGTQVHVEVEEDHHKHSHLKHIVEKVRAANLPARVTERAIAAYQLLAEAEARVHGSTIEKIHFHEVGAKDAILDVAGAMLGVEMLGVDSFSASTVAVGHGTVKCAHGVMPVPAPATAEILKGVPTTATEIEGELTTPTGAAILRVLVGDEAGISPAMKTDAIGYGAGTRVVEGHPNYLRMMLGKRESKYAALPVESEKIVSLETEIDDMSPEIGGYVMEKLFTSGARDVQFQPVQMKKNRSGQHLRVLCHEGDIDRLAEVILHETSTFGVRVMRGDRLCLRRQLQWLDTPLGPVPVKIGLWGDRVIKAKPEYEACRALANSTGHNLREVFDVARRAIQDHLHPEIPK
ncbi:nickel pincer cofactor biosynthesis protein LarC [Candidatus Sumerlaeota bacterium]|nr:nickel pincer cofactor biosynthesis protein LarC [Candidatus Sumerlaeota bacterium]